MKPNTKTRHHKRADPAALADRCRRRPLPDTRRRPLGAGDRCRKLAGSRARPLESRKPAADPAATSPFPYWPQKTGKDKKRP